MQLAKRKMKQKEISSYVVWKQNQSGNTMQVDHGKDREKRRERSWKSWKSRARKRSRYL